MLVYTLCETANLAEAATRRLHLSSLLPQAMQRRKPAVASAGMPGAYPVLEGTTQDFFSDVRHLPDLQAALILSVAYLLLQGGSSHQQRPLPASREELLELGPESLEKIIADLKAKSPGGNFMILTSGNKEARQSIAPLNRQAAYPPGTFADNKIYNLFVGAGLLPTALLPYPKQETRRRQNPRAMTLFTSLPMTHSSARNWLSLGPQGRPGSPASGSTTGRSHPRRRIDAPGSPAPQAWPRRASGTPWP